MTGNITPLARITTISARSATDTVISATSSRQLRRRIRSRGIGALQATGGSTR